MKVIFNMFVSLVVGVQISVAGSDDNGTANLPRKSNAFVDNLDVIGVPEKFMELVLAYVESNSNDALYSGHEIERQNRSAGTIKQLEASYSDKSESYFLQIVKTSNNPLLRRYAYKMFFDTGSNNGQMLDHARQSLRHKNWEEGTYLDLDLENQMRVLVAYGDKSDQALWDKIWPRMDDREQSAFQNYRGMLNKALHHKNKLQRLRAARGEKAFPDESLVGGESDERAIAWLSRKRVATAFIWIIGALVLWLGVARVLKRAQ